MKFYGLDLRNLTVDRQEIVSIRSLNLETFDLTTCCF